MDIKERYVIPSMGCFVRYDNCELCDGKCQSVSRCSFLLKQKEINSCYVCGGLCTKIDLHFGDSESTSRDSSDKSNGYRIGEQFSYTTEHDYIITNELYNASLKEVSDLKEEIKLLKYERDTILEEKIKMRKELDEFKSPMISVKSIKHANGINDKEKDFSVIIDKWNDKVFSNLRIPNKYLENQLGISYQQEMIKMQMEKDKELEKQIMGIDFGKEKSVSSEMTVLVSKNRESKFENLQFSFVSITDKPLDPKCVIKKKLFVDKLDEGALPKYAINPVTIVKVGSANSQPTSIDYETWRQIFEKVNDQNCVKVHPSIEIKKEINNNGVSTCKNCNTQNEYVDYNPDYICYSCKM